MYMPQAYALLLDAEGIGTATMDLAAACPPTEGRHANLSRAWMLKGIAGGLAEKRRVNAHHHPGCRGAPVTIMHFSGLRSEIHSASLLLSVA